MSQSGARRAYQYGSQGGGSTINQKAALASAYQELGKELASSKLKMVGNYTLQRPIGEGTFGKVRLGLHRLTNTRVAIKQIPKAHSASLTREIHHHRRLHHPNIMQLYEVIATEQHIWMVSELCAGGELYDYLVENEVLAEPEARRIVGQLCLAVAYVHSKGIVHRDLKLENILLDERCNVKLGDFGFTREFERKRLMETFCGTTGYASPEMLAGNKYTGEEVDIWSLGVILYALLCGALPFDDDDESIMKDKILRGDFEIPDCLSEEAQSLIASILQHEPSKRPSIEAILAHPWFTKTMAQSSMSTVEEDENALDYFDSRPLASTPQLNESAPEREPVDAAAADAIATTNKDAIGHANARSDHLAATHQHYASASGVSEGSYYSARSGSESSDRRSSNTDLTDPTTADTLSRTDEVSGLDDLTNTNCDPFNKDPLAAASIGASASSSQPNKETIGLHRNESQTTIRRLGSNGSDASLGAVSRPSIKSTSMSLPTHHELPTSSDGKSDDLHMPMYQSVPLVKRGSQSSSRGHHRTPSRTKRRSLSSSGLSDHHPPLLGRKPVDYVSQLAHLQPATFCTAVEQDLLHQLSTLGIDVGQMVHSVMTDACDTSGAMWWMLLRKAKDRQAQQPPGTVPATESAQAIMEQPALAATTMSSRTDQDSEVSHLDGVPPPPVPVKDPARRSEDRSRFKERSRASLTASKSENTGLSESGYRRLQTVVSHEVLDVSSGQSLEAWASGAVIGTAPAVLPVSSASISELPISASVFSTPPPRNDRSLTSTPESTSSPQPKSQHRHTTVASSPSKLHQMASSWVGGSPTSESSKGRRNSHADRPRSNSLSVKQLAQSVLGTKDKAQATPPSTQPVDQVIVAGEALPMERAKNPTLFGCRNTVSNVKGSMVGRRSNPSTPKKAAAEVVDKPRKSMGKNSIETDLDRVKALDRSVNSASSSPSRSGLSLQPASASTLTVVTPASEKKDAAVPSASQDSFSTLSNAPRGSEKSGARGKAGSSFMATVRTWLSGANEKPTRKSKAGKKGPSHRGLGIDDGTSVGRSPTSTLGTSGSVPTLINGTPSRSPSMRRKSAHYQQAPVARCGGPRSLHLGSMSRRSSNGSSHHGHLDLPPNSFSQSMSRPGNMRRMSAGSITPTATLYGDYVNDIGGAAASSRHSRPSSSHSLARSNAAPRSGLHGKADSTGSTSSVYRPGKASSAYSTGSGCRHLRPSHDGGTTVRRHRAYASSSGSPSRRNSFRHDSRPTSIKSRASSPSRAMVGLSEFGVDTEVDGDLSGSGARKSTRSTPRHSLELRNLSDSRKTSDTLEPIHPQHHQVVAQSIFVAHKSRSLYRPPSANPHLHGSLARGQPQANVRAGNTDSSVAAVPSTSTGLPATGTGTWRHSWGRPPPCWAGPVDPPPAESEGGGTAGLGDSNKPKLRDVFAHRDDDDWTDEDEEPSYSGGLGQMGSLSSMTNNAERNCTAAFSSPYATRNFAALGSGQGTGSLSTDSAVSAFRGAAPFSARYAGVRNIFQNQQSGPGSGFRSSHHPVSLSLGNEFTPKLLSATLHSPTTSQPPGVSLGSVAESAASTTAGNATTTGSAKTDSPTQQSQQQTGSRITGTFHKPVQIIEEEEEEEEDE